MENKSSQIECPTCRCQATEAVGEYGSYLLRCASCGEPIVVTSLIAIVGKMSEDILVEACLDHRRNNDADAIAISKITGIPASEILASRPFIRGALAERWETVARIVATGIPLILKFPEGAA